MSAVAPESPEGPQWDLAKVLYSQGVNLKLIAEQCAMSLNALRKRITRQNWVSLRDGLRRNVAIELTKSEAKPLAETGECVRQKLSDELLRVTEALPKLPPAKSVKAITERGEMLKKVADPAKIVFGWQDGGSSNQVNIAVLQGNIVEPDKPSQPIDVQEVKAEQPTD